MKLFRKHQGLYPTIFTRLSLWGWQTCPPAVPGVMWLAPYYFLLGETVPPQAHPNPENESAASTPGCLIDARPPQGRGGGLRSHPRTLHTAAAARKRKLLKPRPGFSQGATILHGTLPFLAFFFLGEYLLTEGPKVNQTNQTPSSRYSSPDPTARSSCHEQFSVHCFRSQTLSVIQINTRGPSF